MESASGSSAIDPQQHAKICADNAQLREERDALKQQLDWFKRQLFGRKSEKRLLDNPDQLDLSALLGDVERPSEPPPTEKITYTRRKGKQRSEDCVTESGLRFDERVPVEVIELSAPQLQGPEADQYEIIDHKVTRKLAQRPGSYVVLEYRRPVLKHKPSATLMEVPAPSAVFDNSLADVSFLAGLLVDKFCYHLPLYRQHQRLADAGITLSRATLTHYTQRAIELLRPIYDAQWQHVLQSKVLAMDETPIKAGKAKLDYRSRHALPLFDAFFGWCYKQRQRLDLVNSAPLAKALVYADNHQAQLRVYLGDPDVPIDTNHLERALRVIPMGRKNWLFCWSEVGARHVGIIQSLLTTCRLHQVDPYAYLVDVLQRVALHPAREVEALTPRCWKERFAANPLRSDLDYAD